MLSASSAYFEAMFGPSFKEGNQSEVTLIGMKGDCLEIMLNYCYCRCLSLNQENVYDILHASSLLQFTDIESSCFEYLMENITPHNCLKLCQIADMYNGSELLNKAVDFVSKYFVVATANQAFLLLNQNIIAQLLKNDNIKLVSDINVFKAMQKWIEYDQAERSQYIPKLLSCIRLEHIQIVSHEIFHLVLNIGK